MDLEIRKKYFVSVLEEVTKVINSNAALISLQGLYIDAKENMVTLIGSNGNISIKKNIEVDEDLKVLTPGKILVPGKLFKEIIKKQGDIIKITQKDNSIEITSNNSKANLNLLDTDDYPIISFDKDGEEFEIEIIKLKEIIKNVAYAAAENHKKLILNGVNIKAKNNKLIVSATNSFRIATETIVIDSNIEFDITLLSSSLKVFLSLLSSGLLKMSINDSKIISEFDNSIIVSNLIDGIYPELERVIPNTFTTTVKTNTKEIDELINKVLVMSTDKKRVTKLTVNNEVMTFEMKRSEIGELIAKSKNFKLEGEEIIIPFDISFLKEAISKVKGDIEMCFNGPRKPFIIRSNSKNRLIQLILPHISY